MKLSKFLLGGCAASAMMVSTAAQAADIVIGVPNWPVGENDRACLEAGD